MTKLVESTNDMFSELFKQYQTINIWLPWAVESIFRDPVMRQALFIKNEYFFYIDYS
jgi:hypothetical protein